MNELEEAGWVLEDSSFYECPEELKAITPEFDAGPDPRPGCEGRTRPEFTMGTYYGFNPRKALAIARQQLAQKDAQIARLVGAFDGRESGEVTMQMLNDAGINPFAVQLLCESFSRLDRKLPVKFKFNDIAFILGANFEPTLSLLPHDYLKRHCMEREVVNVAELIAEHCKAHGTAPLDELVQVVEDLQAHKKKIPL